MEGFHSPEAFNKAKTEQEKIPQSYEEFIKEINLPFKERLQIVNQKLKDKDLDPELRKILLKIRQDADFQNYSSGKILPEMEDNQEGRVSFDDQVSLITSRLKGVSLSEVKTTLLRAVNEDYWKTDQINTYLRSFAIPKSLDTYYDEQGVKLLADEAIKHCPEGLDRIDFEAWVQKRAGTIFG